MEKKVYIIVGTCYPYDEPAFTMVSQHAVKSTLEKAQKVFDMILEEAREEYEDCKVSYNEEKTMMLLEFSSGTEEVYYIHEKEIDF